MAVEIREAHPEDLDGLVASSAALFAEDAGVRDPAADTTWPHHAGRDVIAAGITDPRRLALVAVADGQIVGHLTGVLIDPSVMAMVLVADLRSIYLRPEHRSSGVGTELVTRFVTWARARGAERLSVTAYAANAPAQRFYQRHGFVPHEVVLIAPIPEPSP